jgi:hypothetical protein
MIVYLNDGIIAAMPDDPVGGGYNQNEVFTSEAPPRQYYGKMTVTSPCSYGENNVLKQAASPPLAYQVSPPLAYESSVAVLSLRRQAERFYASQIAAGRSSGPHIFLRRK